ncbi:hypothetical protein Pelo_5179 [Pelomyxa schiedti]|nr:hypothetical protein Pelo_5179 [Pelomyxa schiedti]
MLPDALVPMSMAHEELTFHCSCLQVFFKGFACDDDVVDVHQPLEGIGLLCIRTLFCEYLLVQVYFKNIRQWIVILDCLLVQASKIGCCPFTGSGFDYMNSEHVF